MNKIKTKTVYPNVFHSGLYKQRNLARQITRMLNNKVTNLTWKDIQSREEMTRITGRSTRREANKYFFGCSDRSLINK